MVPALLPKRVVHFHGGHRGPRISHPPTHPPTPPLPPLFAQVMPLLLSGCGDRDSAIRQCCVYGLGTAAQHRREGFRQHAQQAVPAILAVLQAPDARWVRDCRGFGVGPSCSERGGLAGAGGLERVQPGPHSRPTSTKAHKFME